MAAPRDHPALLSRQDDPVFRAQHHPTVLLDTDLTIRAANPAYLSVTGRAAEELIGVNIFEAFPRNPADETANEVQRLVGSMETVMRTRRHDELRLVRYDIVTSGSSEYTVKYWSPVSAPVTDDEDVVGIVHQVTDVTELQREIASLARHMRAVATSPTADDETRRLSDQLLDMASQLSDYQAVVEEVLHLRRAMLSRPAIDQAKGIIMAERRCSSDEAFAILTKLSQDSNVRVADIAAWMVHQAQGGRADRPDWSRPEPSHR